MIRHRQLSKQACRPLKMNAIAKRGGIRCRIGSRGTPGSLAVSEARSIGPQVPPPVARETIARQQRKGPAAIDLGRGSSKVVTFGH